MKTWTMILLLFAGSFGEMIGDFAPMKVGSKWEYSYYRRYLMSKMQFAGYIDSAIISIVLFLKTSYKTIPLYC